MTKLVPARRDSNWPLAHVSLDGHEILAMFDTGASLSTVTYQGGPIFQHGMPGATDKSGDADGGDDQPR